MENFDEHTDALIARHLAGETTPEEGALLQAWISESTENQRYFADIQAIWKRSSTMRPTASRAVDTEAALGEVKRRIQNGGTIRPLAIRSTLLWRVAASLTLVLTAVYLLWLRNPAAPPVVIAASDTALTDTLTDGSVVNLSRQSGIALASGFNGRERRLRLQGEAYFKVSHDTTRPFIVEVSDLEVRVVGTAFNIDNVTDSSSVLVTVTEGKVRVRARGQTMVLIAGESARYEKSTGRLARWMEQQNPAQSRVLWFDATPLREVLPQIEKIYGVKITLKNKALEDCLLTARYNNQPLDRVLDLVAESFSIQVTKTANGEYVLDGAGCGE